MNDVFITSLIITSPQTHRALLSYSFSNAAMPKKFFGQCIDMCAEREMRQTNPSLPLLLVRLLRQLANFGKFGRFNVIDILCCPPHPLSFPSRLRKVRRGEGAGAGARASSIL